MSSEIQKPIHRSCIYRVSSKGLPEGKYIYIKVLDTLENPIEDSQLPDGKLIFVILNTRFDIIEKRTKNFCQCLGEKVSDLRDFGMF